MAGLAGTVWPSGFTVTILAAVMVLFPPHAARADTGVPAPKVIVALIEEPGMTLPNDALPVGVRFVLYDDGEVFVQPAQTESVPSDTLPFQFGHIDAKTVEAIRRRVRDGLSDLNPALNGNDGSPDQSSTFIDFWDAGTQRYKDAVAYGWPCAAQGRDLAGAFAPKRSLIDPKFLKVCDWLSGFRVTVPKPWTPKNVQLSLTLVHQAPEHLFDWPQGLPTPQVEEHVYVGNCVSVAQLPASLTRMLETRNPNFDHESGFPLGNDRWAKIMGWQFDLPSGIPTLDQKGAVDRYLGVWCSAEWKAYLHRLMQPTLQETPL